MSKSHNIACKEHQIPPATFSETQGGIQVEFRTNQEMQQESRLELQPELEAESKSSKRGQVTGQVTGQVESLLNVMQGELSKKEIMVALGLSGRDNFEKRYLKPALEQGLITPTIPDKPNSRLQKYRVTSGKKSNHE